MTFCKYFLIFVIFQPLFAKVKLMMMMMMIRYFISTRVVEGDEAPNKYMLTY